MNLPNKLTLWRIILVPFFVAALLIPFPLHTIVALVLFIAASITDMLDGRIARKRNLITDFGKFADPLADKILVLAALLCFVQNGWCDCIAVIIVLAMNLVGSLLVSALVIFPALSAMRVFKSFRSVTICAAVISVVCALAGIIVSILMDTPVGSTIVITDIAAFLVCTIIGKIKG